ncbi:hypothetical protein [Acetobacter sp.]|uniref:hypothetical protein n=1 Tax=Acetobacter sp. TaxID=440 RepID=UPI0025911448|nr:hypothetical protein [Acetobacter sp.]MCC6105999.1 hypothetical protein [Acetobacter sp.]
MAVFYWGQGGQPLSQDDIERQYQTANALLQRADNTPATSWAGALGNMLYALSGKFHERGAREGERQNDDYNQDTLAKLLMGGNQQAQYAAPPQASAPGGMPQQSSTPNALAQALINPTTGSASPVAKEGATALITQNLLDHMRQAESGGYSGATNPNSSATGAYQFTSPTWTALMNQHPDLGLTADGRTDPQQSQVAAKQLATDNIAYLLAKGVQNPTEGQAYLAHFAGAPTAANLIQASPNTPVAQVMSPQQIAANPFLRGMTAGQVQDWAAQKMGGSVPTQPAAQNPQYSAPVTAQMPNQTAPQMQSGPSMQALVSVLSDPRANSQTKGIASAMLNNQLQLQQVQQRYQMEQADPENVARRRYYDMETQALQQRMNAPAKQGPEYRLLSSQEKQTLGLPAGGNYQIDATGKVSAIGGGGVNVLPNAPAGYYYQPGPDGQTTLQPVPGGPVDQAKKNKSDGNATTNDVLTRTASDLFGLLKSNPRLSAGALSIPLAYSPESSAAQLRRLNSTLGAIGSLSSLQQMRDQSPTGGALGNVTEKEEALLARKFGTLDPNSSPDVYEKNARDYVKTLYQIVNGNEAGQSLFNKNFSEANPQPNQAAPSVSDMINAAKPIAPGVSYRKGG